MSLFISTIPPSCPYFLKKSHESTDKLPTFYQTSFAIAYLVSIRKLLDNSREGRTGAFTEPLVRNPCMFEGSSLFRYEGHNSGAVPRPITRGSGKVPVRPEPALSGWKLSKFYRLPQCIQLYTITIIAQNFLTSRKRGNPFCIVIACCC